MKTGTRAMLIIMVSVVLLAGPQADAKRMELVGDDFRYYRSQDRFEVEGNVRIEMNGVLILADWVEVDTRSKIVRAKGDVYVQDGDWSLHTGELKRDYAADRTLFFQARATFEAQEADTPLYFTSPRMETREDALDIWEGQVTTCDLDQPHYFFRAREATVYDEWLVARHVTFWELEGRLPLVYWPRIAMSQVHPHEDIVPDIGYSTTKGWFMRTAHHYFADDTWGSLHLDYYALLGLGAGFKQRFLSDDRDVIGSVRLYGLQDRRADAMLRRLEGGGEYTVRIPELEAEMRMEADFEHRPRSTDELVMGARVQVAPGWGQLDLRHDSTWRQPLGCDAEQEMLTELALALPDLKSWDWDTRLVSERIQNQAGDYSMLAGHSRLARAGRAYDFELLLERRAPRWRDREDAVSFVRLPELSLGIRPGHLGSLPVPVTSLLEPVLLRGSWGRYEEDATRMEAMRTRGEVRYITTLEACAQLSLAVDQRSAVHLYSTSPGAVIDSVYGVNDSRLSLRYLPAEGFRVEGSYRYRCDEGYTPFRFDRVTDHQGIHLLCAYQHGENRIRVRTGYDVLGASYQDLRADISLRPDQEASVRLGVVYSLQNERAKRILAQVEKGNEDYGFQLALEAGERFQLEQVDGRLEVRLGDSWRAGLAGRYDARNDRLEQARIMLSRDLHCRELALSYDHVEQAIWLEYNIIAFPDHRARVGWDQEKTLFDVEVGDAIGF